MKTQTMKQHAVAMSIQQESLPSQNGSVRKRIGIALLVTLTFFCLMLAVVPASAQNVVPPTARQAMASPEFAARLAAARTANKSRAPAPSQTSHASPMDMVVLYDNGPYNGTTDAWTINFGYAVSDSFNVPSGSGIGGLHFVYWAADTSDLLTTVDMSIGSTAFGGSPQTLTDVTNTFLGMNQFGYVLYQADYSFENIAWSGAGYITLSNACTPSGCSVNTPIYWDENSGTGCTSEGCPSVAYENTLGSIPSETFEIDGDDQKKPKTVVCISFVQEPGDSFVSSAEGYERALARPGEKIVKTKLKTKDDFSNCVGLVNDGDTLVIVAHSNEGGRGIFWGGKDDNDFYTDFGSGEQKLPVPGSFTTLKNVTIEFVSCYSNCPRPGTESLCAKILKAAGGDKSNTCKGYNGEALPGALPKPDDDQKTTRKARQAGAKCLADACPKGRVEACWADYPPKSSGAKANQQTEAQKVINGCEDAKDKDGKPINFVDVSYSLSDGEKECKEESQFLPSDDPSGSCGGTYSGLVGPPSQCQVSGPSQAQVGTPTSITSTVQALVEYLTVLSSGSGFTSGGSGFIPEDNLFWNQTVPTTGVPSQKVVYTTLAGSVIYVNGVNSGNGTSATFVTNEIGEANATVVPTRAGPVFIMITVQGTDLVQYSSFTAY